MSESTVYVVRHAEAGERAAWRHADRERPLTATGRHQSEAISERLAAIPFQRLTSSPFLRCLQTLEPLAAALRIPIEARQELAEGQPVEYVEKLVLEAADDGPAIVCVHGDGIRALLQGLADRDIELVGESSEHAKGSTWILRIVEGVIVSGRYQPPPD